MRSSRFLSFLVSRTSVLISEAPVPLYLPSASDQKAAVSRSFERNVLFTSTSNIPAGHKKSDLRDVACNIRLSRMRDITLRRDIRLYENDKSLTLEQIFKGTKALLVGVPGGKVCCQQHLPGYLEKTNELGRNMLDKIIIVSSSSNDDQLNKLMKSSDKTKVCFYEDRDLSFARMLGLERDEGPKTQRFAAVLNDGILLRINVEKHPREVKETSYDVLLDIWKQFCAKP
eukprot:g5892.t1